MESQPGVGGPWVSVAAFCDRVIDLEGGEITMERIVDSFEVALDPDEESDGVTIETTLVVQVQAGDIRGPVLLRIDRTGPAGEHELGQLHPVTFTDELPAVQLVSPMKLYVTMPGTHWFDVFTAGRRLTRTPLRVAFHRREPGQSPTDRPTHSLPIDASEPS